MILILKRLGFQHAQVAQLVGCSEHTIVDVLARKRAGL